mgnify:FL=1
MPEITRRALVGGGIALSGAVLLSACSRTDAAPSLVSPGDDIVDMIEAGRASTGREHRFELTAAETELDLGGTRVRTWSYGDDLPGPELRVRAGDTVVATLLNNLPDPTTVHCHGLALRSDMDGVPPLTQKQIAPGERFEYRFVAANAGTHWFHPHVGTQFDRGLYAPIIVEDPSERLSYDQEWVIILDDWLDGVESTPDQVLEELRAGMDHGGHGMGEEEGPMRMGSTLMGATSDLLGGDAGDVYYPMHLVSGRPPNDPRTFEAAPGDRVRIRLINAGADTAYRVALGGHTMTITHTDGYAVEHTEADALLLGMGERYDVLVTLDDGVFPLVALAEGKDDTGFALVRTGSGSAPDAGVRPEELEGRVLVATDLTAEEGTRLSSTKPDVVHDIELTGSMADYDWGLNGRVYDHENPTAGAFTVTQGQRVRLVLTNTTDMWHPMHLHGHHVQIGEDGPRKDTLIVLPGQTLTCDFDADNPGLWMTHCHNLYHGESGMMGVVAYTA